ncbi:MAG: SdpI family protein [Synergistaceae bacterium]|nr:SdpI family protein [Synergistaceae bacterium]
MGFYILILIMSSLVPFTMIGGGIYFTKGGPKEINSVIGYRTSMSMKNKNTWMFAHNYCGKLWSVIGWVMLPLSVGLMFLVLGREIDVIGWFAAALVIMQCVFLVIPIIFVEKALRDHFDDNGNRIV